MTLRNPLVLVGGEVKELPAGDMTLNGKLSTWTASPSATSTSMAAMCFGNRRFVCVGSGSVAGQYSEDGEYWQDSDLPAGDWKSVAYGNGKFIAVSSTQIAYSYDGASWGLLAPVSTNTMEAICFGNGFFIVVCSTGASSRGLISQDGVGWAAVSLSAATPWYAIAFGAGVFVAVSTAGTVAYTTSTGTTWSPVSTQPQSCTKTAILYGNNRFMNISLIGGDGEVQTSTDRGTTWVVKTGVPGTGNIVACFGAGVFVAIRGGVCYVTSEGDAWVKAGVGPTGTARGCVGFGDGVFAAPPAVASANDVWSAGTRRDQQPFVLTGVADLQRSEAIKPTAFNSTRLFGKGLANRILPAAIGSNGSEHVFQPSIWRQKIARWNPAAGVTTVPGVDGMGALTAVGTATARTILATNPATRSRRLAYVSAATAGALCGHYSPVAMVTLGNGSGVGGFFYSCRFCIADSNTVGADAVTGARTFVGLSSSLAAPTNVSPATLTNCVGLAILDTSSLMVMVYGGSTAGTPLSLGSSFTATPVLTDLIELTMWSPPKKYEIVYYRVENISTGVVVEGSITGIAGVTTPAATTLLAPRAWRSNNTTAAVVELDIMSIYIETDY